MIKQQVTEFLKALLNIYRFFAPLHPDKDLTYFRMLEDKDKAYHKICSCIDSVTRDIEHQDSVWNMITAYKKRFQDPYSTSVLEVKFKEKIREFYL